MTASEKRFLPAERVVSWLSFAILLVCYWITAAPTVSFWDCPEYVSAAALLEVGHPPGNPTWMLAERIVTMLAPKGYEAYAVNLSSGLLTAFAAFFLAKSIFRVALWVLLKMPRRGVPAPVAAAGAALVGTLAFGWCDSTWFSAVEAEVYAMSIFMTSLTVWLMTVWAGERNQARAWRLLILIAYLFGLSIGIHQLNLLVIPAMAMAWAVKRGIRRPLTLIGIFLLSGVAVAMVLMAMMPSTIALASRFEVFATNILGLPALTGVALYVAALGAALILALTVTARTTNRGLAAVACFPAVFLSGILIFSSNFLVGVVLSAFAAYFLTRGRSFKPRRLNMSMWMLSMLLAGYSSYALIPIRGSIPSPANSAMPGNPFAFATYQSREQYGYKPLLYGATPYSRPLLVEEYDSAARRYRYPRYFMKEIHPVMAPAEPEGRLADPYGRLSPSDSTANAKALARGTGYVKTGVFSRQVRTPELNMWFPRITGNDPYDIQAYADWVGMTPASMKSVKISEAVDSLGRMVPKRDFKGDITAKTAPRPTYLQNFAWFATYQTGYMYWRYLLWNFSGRQNDIPSQGEVQHGNFITGFTPLDNAMLGAEDALPAEAGADNPGRNRYFLLPLLLGVAGMLWLLNARRRGQQTCAIIAVLFIMTGLAIVIYLNQGPGEPRERDYSFLGSFLAYAVWIGFGAVAVVRFFRSAWGFVIPLLIVCWMGWENFDDHNRSGRYVASTAAANILNSLEPNAVIFVNGDNYTFPLWYAQEVEGVRRDVRVVNLAYLSSPVYAANLMVDWRDSRALQTTLRRHDIIYNAFFHATIPAENRDTLPAVEALEGLRGSASLTFPSRYVTLPAEGDSLPVLDLRALSRRNSDKSLDFSRLMMLDILANAGGRPVYWLRQVAKQSDLGLKPYTTETLYARRFGVLPQNRADSLLLNAVAQLQRPNLGKENVYMDQTPAGQVASQRGALILAGERLLAAGKPAEAARMAWMADFFMGDDPRTFVTVSGGDSAVNVRKRLAALYADAADSLRLHPEMEKPGDRIPELKARARYHERMFRERREAWARYRSALPQRLLGKISPTP